MLIIIPKSDAANAVDPIAIKNLLKKTFDKKFSVVKFMIIPTATNNDADIKSNTRLTFGDL